MGHKTNTQTGFTIVELLIVIVVIGILAALSLVAYTGIQKQAAIAVLKADLKSAQTQLDMIKAEEGSFPVDITGLAFSDATHPEYTSDNDSYCLTISSTTARTSFYLDSAGGNIKEGKCDTHEGYTGAVEPPAGNQGVVTTLAGSGTAGFADGFGTAAQFSSPYSVAVDGVGNAYVADLINNRIRKISAAGEVTTLAGSGTAGYVNGGGTAAQFNRPAGVAIDASGNVYVADRNTHRIRKISPSGYVSLLAGSGVAGSMDGTGAAAQFRSPNGIAVDGDGFVYVADTGNHRIRKISPSGEVITFAGSSQGIANGEGMAARFRSPNGITVTATGDIYVADSANHRICKISPSGVVTTLAGWGVAGSMDGTGAAAQFNNPYGVAVSPMGTVYVADYSNHRIRKISPGGEVTTFAGSVAGYTNDTGTAAQFNGPDSIVMDAAGTLYVTDVNNHSIRKIK